MAAAHIAYETDTGTILAIQHFQDEPDDPQSLKRAVASLTDVAETGITVISVERDEIDPQRSYKVDHERKTLIDVPYGEVGVRFSFEEIKPPS